MYLTRATQQHLPAILEMLADFNAEGFYPEFINNKDISLVALEHEKVIGFIWVGLMAKGTVGYIDWFIVRPEYQHLGVASKLGEKMHKVAKLKNLKKLYSLVDIQSESAEAVVACASAIGLQPQEAVYAFLSGDV